MTLDIIKAETLPNALTVEQVDIIKRTMGSDLTDDELSIFLHICNRVRLDPLAKQIYAIKRKGRMCIQTGIDGFRLIAERSRRYSPGQDTEFLTDKNNRLVGAKVYVKKLTQEGTWHQISATAFLDEYRGNTPLWAKMPSVMIEKCAEARALRRAFPADLSGLYTADEMDQANDPIIQHPPIDAVSKEEKDLISEKDLSGIEEFIDGDESISKEMLALCCVQSLDKIKTHQLEACRSFALKKRALKKG